MMINGAVEVITASIVAGLTQHAALHPLDTLKVRLQYSKGVPMSTSVRGALGDALRDLELPPGTTKAARPQPPKESRLWRAPLVVDLVGATRLLRRTPLKSLYAGLVPSLVAVVPTAVVYMPVYEAAAAVFGGVLPTPIVAPAAGVATGVACSLVRVPLSVAKSRVQLGLAPSAGAALRQAYATGGAAALYTGFGATLALDVAVAVVQFTALDAGRRHLDIKNSAALGFMASALSTACTEPVDVVRTRIMAQLRRSCPASCVFRLREMYATPRGPPRGDGVHRPPSPRYAVAASTLSIHAGGDGAKAKGTDFNYTSLADGLRKAAAEEGLVALYRGLLPRLLLKSVGGAIWYSTYVSCRAALGAPVAAHK